MRSRQSGYGGTLRLRLRLQQSSDEGVIPHSTSGTRDGAVDRCLDPICMFLRHVDWCVRSYLGTSGRHSPRSPVGGGVARRLCGVRLSAWLPRDNAGRAPFLPCGPRGLETMVALSRALADSRCGDRHRTGGAKVRRSHCWAITCDLRTRDPRGWPSNLPLQRTAYAGS
jgi:hypothetical protein